LPIRRPGEPESGRSRNAGPASLGRAERADGGGKTIFADDGAARPFELVSTVTANTGVLLNRSRRAR
jgi:hypothetical protein